MKKTAKISAIVLALLLVSSFTLITSLASASNDTTTKNEVTEEAATEEAVEKEDSSTGAKAIASGIAIGLAGLGGALGMGMAISKSVDGISRQPEAESKIRSAMMIGVVFIETVVIYALIVAILVIFVL